jgi:DNA (cytosine-5)-methyltransferase 1
MKILDLFCGAGGAARGYSDAGFEVLGVDAVYQPHYPYAFYEEDVFSLPAGFFQTQGFDLIHASPPCQTHTVYRNNKSGFEVNYEDLIQQTRVLLKETGLPYVIENVPGSPLIRPVVLCGSMFPEMHDVKRHRHFETNWFLTTPRGCNHSIWSEVKYVGGRSGERGGKDVKVRKTIEVGRRGIPIATQKWGMGIDWNMTIAEISEAVPPAYTKHIGEQFRNQLDIA